VGWNGVALNHLVVGRTITAEDHADRIETVSLEDHSLVSPLRLEPSRKYFTQLKRLTLVIDSPSQLQALHNRHLNVYKSYDIVAIQPTTPELLQKCFRSDLSFDLISFDYKHIMQIRRQLFGQAHDTGVFLEITYADALKEATRKSAISNAIDIVLNCTHKNIIISSEAKNKMELRGPYDVINLGVLYGMNPAIAKNCLTKNATSLLLHGETRKLTHKAALSLHSLNAIPPQQRWQIPDSATDKEITKRKRLDNE